MSDASRHQSLSQPAASSEEDIREMASAMDRAALDRRFKRERDEIRRELQGMGSNNTFNGSTKYVNAMLAVITGLMIASVCAMWGMYGKVEAMAVEIKDVKGTVDLIVAGKIKP